MSRQKLIGWALIIVSSMYMLYFLKVRLLEPGPALQRKEWVQFGGSVLIFMLGTMNVRMAAMRRRQRDGLPPGKT